jgi:hypothetical protein
VAKKAVMVWMTQKTGSPQQDLEHVKGFLQAPPANRTRELLELIKEEPAETGDRTTYGAVSPKRTPFHKFRLVSNPLVTDARESPTQPM